MSFSISLISALIFTVLFFYLLWIYVAFLFSSFVQWRLRLTLDVSSLIHAFNAINFPLRIASAPYLERLYLHFHLPENIFKFLLRFLQQC